jgi:3-hydroxyacyl-[acyl-carrier-protein] dehydratase
MKLSKEDIKKIIPHREPFLFIDEIVEISPGKSVKAIKYVKGDEFYFKGHFPENPIMPGVIIIETMAQAGAVSLLMLEQYKGKLVLFAGIDNAKFKKIVRPNDVLEMEVEIISLKMNVGRAKAVVKVNNELACSAELLFYVS